MRASKRIRKPYRSIRSFTLVEVVVSLFILATVASTVMHGFIVARRITEGTIRQTVSTNVAQAFLEQIKVMGYEALRQVVDDPTNNPLPTCLASLSGISSSIVQYPMYVGETYQVPVHLDIDKWGIGRGFYLGVRPELRDLFQTTADALPAIEVTLHYAYISNARTGNTAITGQEVKYVVPQLGSTSPTATP